MEGLHLACNEPYDAAIVDIMLPRLDGLSLIEHLRKQHHTMPVLILSAKRSSVRGSRSSGRSSTWVLGSFERLLSSLPRTELHSLPNSEAGSSQPGIRRRQ